MKILLSMPVLLVLVSCGQESPQRMASNRSESKKCVPAGYRLCPTDEAMSDSSFLSARRQMIEAVEAKDEAKLLAMIDPAIRTSFGDEGGIEAFKKMWKLETASSPVWDELEEILENGGRFRGVGGERSFWAPSVYAAWPDSLDAFVYVAAMGAEVPLRSAPADSATEIERVDWEILERMQDETSSDDSKWIQVRTAQRKVGWVRESDVRSPIDYRAGFKTTGGEWRMNVLVAGD
jgi:hypothetical protein